RRPGRTWGNIGGGGIEPLPIAAVALDVNAVVADRQVVGRTFGNVGFGKRVSVDVDDAPAHRKGIARSADDAFDEVVRRGNGRRKDDDVAAIGFVKAVLE